MCNCACPTFDSEKKKDNSEEMQQQDEEVKRISRLSSFFSLMFDLNFMFGFLIQFFMACIEMAKWQHRMWSNKLHFIDSNNTIKHLRNAHSFTRNEYLNSSSYIFKMFPYRVVASLFFIFIVVFLDFILSASSVCVLREKEWERRHCKQQKAACMKAWIWIFRYVVNIAGNIVSTNEDEKW